MPSYTIKNLTREDNSLTGVTASIEGSSSFLQSPFWASFKGAHGWHPLYFTVTLDDGSVHFLSILTRRIARLFTMAYVPMGPSIASDATDPSAIGDLALYAKLVKDLALRLKGYLPRMLLFIRFDPPIDCNTIEEKLEAAALLSHSLTKTKVDIQPPDTVLLDLSPSLDELLSNMKPKWRYNIRLAIKKGVTIDKISYDGSNIVELEGALEEFYTIFMATAARDGIAIHYKSYYLDLLKSSKPHSKVTLYLARHLSDLLAAIIVLNTDSEGVYLYGASSNIKRNYMSTYLLQWQAISDTKGYGAKVYDFYGIPPTAQAKHPMHGLYLFKTGFGGKVIHRPGSFDVPSSPLYTPFILLERFRAFWYKKVKKALKDFTKLSTKVTGCGGTARSIS